MYTTKKAEGIYGQYWRVAFQPEGKLRRFRENSTVKTLEWYLRIALKWVKKRLIIWAVVPNAEGYIRETGQKVDGWIL